MRIIWHSNTAWASTGYANQTMVFVPRIQRAGHEVMISAFYGLQGGVLNMGETQILPGSKDAYGNDMLLAHKEFFAPDAMMGLLDIWVLNPDLLKALGNWYNWTPVDHDPLPPPVAQGAMAAKGIIAMSRFGERMLKEGGIKNVFYVPHGVDSQAFKPIDRAAARKKLKLADDVFVALMVLANKGAPSRKAFDQQIRAFAAFHQEHPNSVLWLHTDLIGLGGENIKRIIELAGLPGDAWRASPQYQYTNGMIGTDYLRDLYNAADVTLNATRGEGFGIPIIESQMCGTPVIVTDFSAMPELVGAGWKVEYAEKVFTGQDSYQVIPSTESIREKLVKAYNMRNESEFRKEARKFALKYDADKVMGTYWRPVLEQIEAQVMPEKPEPAVTIQSRKVIQDGLVFHENGSGGTAKDALKEVSEHYGLDTVELKDGDVVLDLGANVGVVSCYLGKKFPKARIIAVEPVLETYQFLLKNIAANGLENVTAIHAAVSWHGDPVHIYANTTENAGGASVLGGSEGAIKRVVRSVTLHELLAQFKIERVALLKFDIEGAEYGLFDEVDFPWGKVDRVVGEIHIMGGYTREKANALADRIKSKVKETSLAICEVPSVAATDDPDISIIIPTLNGEKTIKRAIDAALDQDVLHVQVIVIDDGSTDGTAAILKSYGTAIQVITHAENVGQVPAMNAGLSAALGRYIHFHGDDDWLEKGGLERLVMALDAAPDRVGFAYGHLQYHGGRTDTVFAVPYMREDYDKHFPAGTGVIWRRLLADTHGLSYRTLHEGKTAHAEDFDMIKQIIAAGYDGMAVNALIIHYTLADGRATAWLHQNQDKVLPVWKERWPEFEGAL